MRPEKKVFLLCLLSLKTVIFILRDDFVKKIFIDYELFTIVVYKNLFLLCRRSFFDFIGFLFLVPLLAKFRGELCFNF
jgi:hypothetical protein